MLNTRAMLIILFACCIGMLYFSYDYATQLHQFNFENGTEAQISWIKDLLLSSGTSGIVAIILIFSYNEFESKKERKEKAKICSIAAKWLFKPYENYALLTYLNLGRDKVSDQLSVIGGADVIRLNLLDDKFIQKLRQINLFEHFEDNSDWASYIDKNFDQLNNDVNEVLKGFGSYFDEEIINSIDRVKSSKFLKDIKFEIMFDENKKEFYFDSYYIENYKDHINDIINLMKKLLKCMYP